MRKVPIHEKIKVLCEKYSLPDAIKKEIEVLCKEAYISGGNDTHAAMRPILRDLTPKNNPYRQ